MTKPRVVFVCSGNSTRSQMAEAFPRQFTGDHFEVYSAGLHANPIHPLTIQVMEEPGCDLSKHTSKKFSQYLGKAHFDISITVYDKAREECLMLPSLGIRLD